METLEADTKTLNTMLIRESETSDASFTTASEWGNSLEQRVRILEEKEARRSAEEEERKRILLASDVCRDYLTSEVSEEMKEYQAVIDLATKLGKPLKALHWSEIYNQVKSEKTLAQSYLRDREKANKKLKVLTDKKTRTNAEEREMATAKQTIKACDLVAIDYKGACEGKLSEMFGVTQALHTVCTRLGESYVHTHTVKTATSPVCERGGG